MEPCDCETAFSGVLRALHNQCLYSNALYALAGVFGIAALPGWWKLIGAYVVGVAGVSYVHHTQEKALGLGAAVWSRLDSTLATGLVIAGAAALVGLLARPDTRKEVGFFFGGAVFLLAIYSLGIYFASRVAAQKAGESNDEIMSWGGGPLLAQRQQGEAAAQQPSDICSKQRYRVDYLALHSSWHGLSAAAILLMLVALRRALVSLAPAAYTTF